MPADEPIRVLRLIARLNVGGPALHVALVSAGLEKRGYRGRLLAGHLGRGEGDMEYVARDRGVSVEMVPGLGREISVGGDLRALSHIRRVCEEFRPHVIHTHTAKAGTVGRIAGMLWNRSRPRGAPRAALVHTFHGHVLRGYFGRAKEGAFRTIERTLARTADRLVVPAKRIADDLLALRIGRPEQYRVVPLGFELDPFLAVPPRDGTQGVLRQKYGIPGDAILIGIVGRLTAIKNHRMFLVAASRLKRRTRHEIRFAVIGDGELRTELENEARRLGIEDRVVFTGWRSDLAAIYADLDVLALTSRNEGTPVAVIEAMASGRAVVSTAVGGVAEVVEDAVSGLLVDVEREDLFAIALGRLADDDELRTRLATAARESAANRFRIERLVGDLDELYRSLLDRTGARPDRPAENAHP